jgi:hypothetical protein
MRVRAQPYACAPSLLRTLPLARLCARALALLMASGLPGVCALALLAADPPQAAAADQASVVPPRIEARSADLLAVGIVHGDRMAIHVSRSIDNAPLSGAVLTVLLRGVAHPTTAEADGGYTLETHDLALPGSASLVFHIAQGDLREELKGTLQIAETAKPEDKNSARQLAWWVLNFAVCIGFLMLISRRRKAAAKD